MRVREIFQLYTHMRLLKNGGRKSQMRLCFVIGVICSNSIHGFVVVTTLGITFSVQLATMCRGTPLRGLRGDSGY